MLKEDETYNPLLENTQEENNESKLSEELSTNPEETYTPPIILDQKTSDEIDISFIEPDIENQADTTTNELRQPQFFGHIRTEEEHERDMNDPDCSKHAMKAGCIIFFALGSLLLADYLLHYYGVFNDEIEDELFGLDDDHHHNDDTNSSLSFNF